MVGLGNLGDLGSLMKGAQEMQRRLAELQEQLGDMIVDGEAGGGLVRVVANCRSEVLNVEIDPTLLDGGDREMLQDFVAAATNLAMSKAKEASQEKMNEILGTVSPAFGNIASLMNPGA